MTLIREYPTKTQKGTPVKIQIWENHHQTFEAHIFTIDNNIFSSYDQPDTMQATATAFQRAATQGY